MERHKLSIAYADSYMATCPYKHCGHGNSMNSAAKGTLVRCTNCRKEFKIKKVVCK